MPSIRIETCRPAIGTISQAGGRQAFPFGVSPNNRGERVNNRLAIASAAHPTHVNDLAITSPYHKGCGADRATTKPESIRRRTNNIILIRSAVSPQVVDARCGLSRPKDCHLTSTKSRFSLARSPQRCREPRSRFYLTILVDLKPTTDAIFDTRRDHNFIPKNRDPHLAR
jgi:hypothetical protein